MSLMGWTTWERQTALLSVAECHRTAGWRFFCAVPAAVPVSLPQLPRAWLVRRDGLRRRDGL